MPRPKKRLRSVSNSVHDGDSVAVENNINNSTSSSSSTSVVTSCVSSTSAPISTCTGIGGLSGFLQQFLPDWAEDKKKTVVEEKNLTYLAVILQEFSTELQRKETELIGSDSEWFFYMELKFLCAGLYQLAYMELALCATKPDHVSDSCNPPKTKRVLNTTDRHEMAHRLVFLENLYGYIDSLGKNRLEYTKSKGGRIPRVFRLAKVYNMSETDTEILQLLVVFRGCQSNSVRCHVLEDDAQRRMMAVQRLIGISEIDLAEFHEDTREYVKEGTLLVDEEHFGSSLHLSQIAVRVLLGNELTENQVLKLSQTALEDVLRKEGMNLDHYFLDSKHNNSSISPSKEAEKLSEDFSNNKKDSEAPSKEDVSSAYSFIGSYTNKRKQGKETFSIDDTELDEEESESNIHRLNTNSKQHSSETVCSAVNAKVMSVNGTKEELSHYNPKNQLEYLEDRFQVIAFAIRASGARVKDQMKEAGTKQPWETSNAAPTAGRRELKAKQRVHDRRVAHRLALTTKAGYELPRLEQLTSKFKLNSFEQNVIVMLISKTISPVIKNLIDSIDTSPVQRMDESTTINQILSVFCDTFQNQVAHRVYFYKSSRLISRGLVKLHRGRWHSTTGDLVDQRIELDRRVLDWVVGLDTEINELVEGSDLYIPKVRLEQVILPEDHKKTILETVESYESFRAYRKKSGLEENLSYGASLVLLLCGASGTGKTMTVNALADHMKKRVLLVDFPSLRGKKNDNSECDADLRGLFREAEMSNAILFFDECESIFKQREFGGDRLLNALLTEMERYEGIVFLATNRPFDLDEAMHRRITSVFEFKPPDHIQRQKIWKVILSDSIKTSPDIDWNAISLKYELSGGFIKNAIISALLKAISRDSDNPIITESDIIHGCSLQMRGSLHMKTFDHRVVPSSGLDSLVVNAQVKKQLTQIVNFEKARSVIYGQWGFDFGEPKSKQKGISVLLSGPRGVGKSSAAKAIGFEIGRPLKMVNFGQLQMDSASETRNSIRTMFNDARLMDAVLVLQGFETFGSHLEGGANDATRFEIESSRLLDMLNNFPGITILIANHDRSSSSLMNSDFAKRIKFVIEMKSPNAEMRSTLWKSLFPDKAPLDPNVNFKKLGERFELTNSSISDAVFRAAASAALRETDKRVITMNDLMEAAEIERKKARGDTSAMMDRLFC